MTGREPPDGPRQRIDKWLFFARMAKSRSLAQSLIEAGAVTVNGVTCHASRTVRPGDRIELLLENQDVVLIVKAAGDRRGPFEEARLLYEDLTAKAGERKRLTPFERAQRGVKAGKP